MNGPSNQNLYITLLELGLTDEAAHLYLALTEGDSSNLSKIAKQIGISRPHLYKQLNALENLGLIKTNSKGKLQLLPPSEILKKLREKKSELIQTENNFLSLLPKLMENYDQKNLPPKIKVINGQQNFLKLFFQIIEEENSVSEYFGSAADFIGFISWNQENKWIKTRMKKGMKIKALLLPSADARTLQKNDSKELRETRIFLGKGTFITSFQLFANKLIFWQPKGKQAILVEDEYLVAMMKSLFYFCWNASSPR